MRINKLFIVFLFFSKSLCAGQIILKADDFGRGSGWQQFLVYAAENDLLVNIGVIAGDFTNDRREILSALKEVVDSQDYKFAFFYHGHIHRCNKLSSIFLNGTEVLQREVINEDVMVLKNEGIFPIAFGAPCNKNNNQTAEALEGTELKVWLLPAGDTESFSGEVFRRRLNIESSPGKTDVESFLRELDSLSNKTSGTMVVQIHPGLWTYNEITDFAQAIAAIKKKGWTYRLLK